MRLAVETALEGGRVWWIVPSSASPSYGEVWGGLKGRLADVMLDKSEISKQIKLPGGGSVSLKSADRPDSLRGTGIDLAACDEFAQYRDPTYLWNEVIRPSLTDTRGGAIFPSTPKGRANFFHDLYLRGLGDDPEWRSWQHPSWANPYLDPAEIDAARAELPTAAFDQEYGAEFNDAGDSPFRPEDIDAMRAGWTGLADYQHGHRYKTAWDIGRRGDPTVGVTVDYTTVPYQVVAYDRALRLPYPAQQSMIAARAAAYHDKPIIESNGPGDPVIENLDCRAAPFVTTARSKQQALEALTMLLERGAIRADIPQLTQELKAYAWDDKALVQDSVMALAICALHLPKPGTVEPITHTIDLSRPAGAARPVLAGIRSESW